MTTDAVGGVWTYSLEMIRGLEQNGIDVVLATMGPLPSDEQVQELQTTTHAGLYTSDFELEWMDDPWEDVARAGKWLQVIEKVEQPDLVHLNGYAHGALDWMSPCLIVGHSCVLSWWEAVRREQAPVSLDRYRDKVTQGLMSADLVLTPSASMLGALEHHYGALQTSRVVFNGRDNRLFSPGAKKPFVFTAGRTWDDAKNIALLERTASNFDWPLYIAGEETQSSDGPSVRHLGRLSSQAIVKWYASASIYALPARYEPFGLSALEAALTGCALVLGDIPSLREIWGESALFVPPDDERALERSINSLIRDPALLREMSQRARAKAFTYSVKQMVENYLQAVSDIVSLRTKPIRPADPTPAKTEETICGL